MLKTCQFCNQQFSTNREKARYCCDAHRVAGYRKSKGVVTRKVRVSSICLREGCTRSIPENATANARYCSNACRQKVYNDKPENKRKAKLKYVSQADIRKKLREHSLKIAEAKKAEEESNRIADEFIQELMEK